MHYISVCMAYGYGVSGYLYYLPYHIIRFHFQAFTTSLPRGSVAQNDTSTGKWRLRGWRTTLWWTSGAGTTWASPRPAMDRLGRLGRGTAGQTAGKTEVLFLVGFFEISEVKWSHWSFETEDIEDAGVWNFPRKSRKFQEFFEGYFYTGVRTSRSLDELPKHKAGHRAGLGSALSVSLYLGLGCLGWTFWEHLGTIWYVVYREFWTNFEV